MTRVNSKKKGNRGELAVCKILTDRFGKKFNRVPASGAISTIHQLQENSAKTLAGDIITPDNFKFSIENKYGYNIDLYNIFQKENGDKKKFIEFINQAKSDSSKSKNIKPMVIYTRTRKKPLVGIRKEDFSEDYLENINQYIVINVEKKEKWLFLDLKEFLDNTPDDFFYL